MSGTVTEVGEPVPELPCIAALEPGSVLAGRYQIGARLGEGGTGVVYVAYDRVLGDVVALKTLKHGAHRGSGDVLRLAREVRVSRRVQHPNLCRVFELGHVDGRWFATMELAARGSLADLMRQGTMFGDKLRERIARDLIRGVAALHAADVVHGDLTPRNVLLTAADAVKVSDFGLAVDHDSRLLCGRARVEIRQRQVFAGPVLEDRKISADDFDIEHV